ncbi:MAG: class I SAM-dependent methyltransferase family protein [Nanoarchaeota archaeon]
MIVGDIYLSKSNININQIKKQFPYIKTICKISGISGEFRKPKIKKLFGESTITTHKEHGISYNLDVSKIMFSQGNHFEKKRLTSLVELNEVVIDMFAGIGYFTLPIAKKVKHVYAIEKNPESYSFLEKNIRLNYISNVTAIKGDCRKQSGKLGKIADRIIMGYFPGTKKFLPAALKLAKKNCVIHYHEIGENEKEILEQLPKYAKLLKMRKVKSYSPNKNHYVVDFKL